MIATILSIFSLAVGKAEILSPPRVQVSSVDPKWIDMLIEGEALLEQYSLTDDQKIDLKASLRRFLLP